MTPSLSIVTISFNQKPYLAECIASVLADKDEGVEYIIVDPGSTDGSRELIDSHGPAIEHRVFEADAGPADGLNKGFARATGDYFYFLNSDDLLLPGAYAKVRAALAEAGHPDLLCASAWIIDGDGQPLSITRPQSLTPDALIGGTGLMVQQGMLVRSDFYRRTGGFNPANRTCWDLELLFDLIDQEPHLALSDTRFAAFRLHDESLSGGSQGVRHLANYHADLDRLASRYGLTFTHDPSFLGRARRLTRKLLSNPGFMLSDIFDRLRPSAKSAAWHCDTAG